MPRFLVTSESRPHLNRSADTQEAARAKAQELANYYPNHEFMIWAQVDSVENKDRPARKPGNVQHFGGR